MIPALVSAALGFAASMAAAQSARPQVPANPSAPPLAVRVLLSAGEGTIETPFVEYESGRLSLVSDDATLGDVLRAIGDTIGAQIEFPGEIGHERIAARMGPASPQELLRMLLDSSRFDYVILGSPSSPDAVQTVVVTLRKNPSSPQNQVHLVGASAGTATSPVYAGIPRPVASVVKPAAPQTRPDHNGVQRLSNGLTPEESQLTPQELYDKMEFYRQLQRAERQQAEENTKKYLENFKDE
jgi:hypothetical protein